MSKCKALAVQISLSTWFVYSCRRVSRLDRTFSSLPNYLLYFVYKPLKHGIDVSAIDTTLAFKASSCLISFTAARKNVRRWMLFESSHMSCLICRNTISLPDDSDISRYFLYPDRHWRLNNNFSLKPPVSLASSTPGISVKVVQTWGTALAVSLSIRFVYNCHIALRVSRLDSCVRNSLLYFVCILYNAALTLQR